MVCAHPGIVSLLFALHRALFLSEVIAAAAFAIGGLLLIAMSLRFSQD